MASRSGTDEPKAAHLARTVAEVVDEATEGSIMHKVREVLPGAIRSLISAGGSG